MSKIIWHTDIEQNSQEWLNLRLGKITGSEVYKLMGPRGLGKTGMTYIDSIIGEILSGSFDEITGNKYFAHGKDNEPIIKSLYDKMNFAAGNFYNFKDVGFVENEDFKIVGASPDWIEERKQIGIEFKCPYTRSSHKKHLFYTTQTDLKSCKPQYYWQIMLCMLVTGFEQWNFVSYHPEFNAIKDFRVSELYVYRNDKDMDMLTERIAEAAHIIKTQLTNIGVKL